MPLWRLSGWCSLVLVAAAGCVGCATASGKSNDGSRPASASGPVPVAVPFLEERALLLLLSDRQLFDQNALAPLLAGNDELRERLAEAIGRIGDARGRQMLEGLLRDPAAPVRRAAAFALGELEEDAATGALLEAAVDPDPQTGGLACEALGKLEAPLERVLAALATLAPAERFERVLPALFRFKEDAAVRVGADGLAVPDAQLHAWAAYGLARDARPAGAPLLRGLLADPDPWVRGWAARGLGAVGESADLERLRPVLDDPVPGPVIQALRAGLRLVRAGKGAAPPTWRSRLLELFDDPRPGVGVTAIEASAAWLLDETLGAALAGRAGSGAPEHEGRREREAEVAMLALAEARDPRAFDLVAAWSRSPSRQRRLRAAEAAGALADRDALAFLAVDPWPAVRAAVLAARLDASAPEAEARAAATAALTDPAVTVRSGALDWFTEHPSLPLEALAAAVALAANDSEPEARGAAARALGSRAKAVASEEGAAIAALERLAADADFLVRREAAQALVALGRLAPALGPSAPTRSIDHYRSVVETTAAPRFVDLRTRHGMARLRLDCPTAPLTCLSFLQLAAQGYFDGQGFHRVVPDFVVQGGDPGGDGSGGPGYAIRDEINRQRYRRGALGMALSGPDTGGSQFFITLSPQPHLDGGYTVFGEVVEGMEVVDSIVQGDRLERVLVR